jgi:hypothetical protein
MIYRCTMYCNSSSRVHSLILPAHRIEESDELPAMSSLSPRYSIRHDKYQRTEVSLTSNSVKFPICWMDSQAMYHLLYIEVPYTNQQSAITRQQSCSRCSTILEQRYLWDTVQEYGHNVCVCVYCVYCTVSFVTRVEGAGGVGAGGEGVPVDGDEQGAKYLRIDQ